MDPETAAPELPSGDVGPSPTDESHTDPQPTTQAADINGLADILIEESPEPQPHAIAQQAELETARVAQNAEAVKQFPDFNPAIHATNADGSPALTPTGRLAKIRKGRSASPKLTIPNNAGQSAQPSLAQSREVQARAGGAGFANLVIALSVGIGGEEFIPRRDPKVGLDEKAMLEGAFGDYFVATGKTDLPPGWALAAALSLYVVPRFGMPKTQSRFQRAKNWVAVKWINFRLARKGYKVRVRNADEVNRARDVLAGRAILKETPEANDERQPG